MKVKLLPLAVTAAIAMPGLALADGPVVYGKMNVSLENVDVDNGTASADNFQVISNASRFGVKGDGKINSALKATYLIEWGVDGADGATLSNRNRSVGLAGNFGALDVGQFDTPTKVSQGKVDQFNDLAGDLQYVLLGEVRAKNIVQYTSPAMSGLQGKLAIIPGEQFDDGVPATEEKDGLADAMSASVAYTTDMIYLALAHDSEVTTTFYGGVDDAFALEDATATAYDTTRLVGQFTSGPIQVGAIYQMAESSDPTEIAEVVEDVKVDVEQNGYVLSGAYTMGQTVLKAQYSASTTEFTIVDDVFEGKGETDATMLGLGIDQKLSAQTTVFGYYNMLAYEADTVGAKEQTKDNLGVGIVHAF